MINTTRFIKNRKLSSPWIYFSATFVWTWAFFGIAFATNLSAESGSSIGVILILCALSGPGLMGILFVYLALNAAGQKDYWRRIVDFKLISLKWYFAIFLILPTISIISAMISGYWDSYTFNHKLPSFLLTLLSVPLVPILEELGWRGYVLDRLQERYNALSSCLILGALWGLWHLPVFFLPNSIFGLMPVGSLMFWLYMYHEVVISVLFGWIYNNTGRSTLSAILLHIVLEFCANTGIIPWDKPAHIYNVTLWTIFAILITYLFGYKNLTKRA